MLQTHDYQSVILTNTQLKSLFRENKNLLVNLNLYIST